MVENAIKGGKAHAIQRHAKLITSTCKTHYLLYWDRWDISQNLAVYGFEGFEDISKFNKNFRKNHNEKWCLILEKTTSNSWRFTIVSRKYINWIIWKPAALKTILKYFFMLMNWKTMKKVGKQKKIVEFVTTKEEIIFIQNQTKVQQWFWKVLLGKK